MMCSWKELLNVLPVWLRCDVDRLGKTDLQELRLRIKAPPELITKKGCQWLSRDVTKEDLAFCINSASRYSPWSASTAALGYITAPGGHRIGVCGEVACKAGAVTAIREVLSLNIRVARDFPGIGEQAFPLIDSTLIIGAPGFGKTTLLRDISRIISKKELVSVVDERGELFPAGTLQGKRMDVLTGCPKASGIQMVLRSMGPEWIAVDEITAQEDAKTLLHAAGCGVKLLATAHALSVQDLRSRPVYKPLVDNGVFRNVIVMHKDQSYHTERMMG